MVKTGITEKVKTMVQYKIRDEDGDIYTFDGIEEVLEALASSMTGHEYYWCGEWYPGRL